MEYQVCCEFIKARLLENCDLSGNSDVPDIVLKEERRSVAVSFLLNRAHVPIEKETIIVLEEPIVYQPIEPITEVPLRRSQHIKRPAISERLFYFHKSNFNICQSNDLNSYDEALSYFDGDSL